MVRQAITFWLIFGTAIGHGLCCCTVASASVPTRDANRTVVPATSKKTTRLCCGNQAQTSEPGKNDQKPDQNHRSPCPCKEKAEKATVLPPQTGSGVDFAGKTTAGPLDYAVQSEHSYAAISAHDTRGESPGGVFLSTEKLLHVFHNLRC